MCHFSEVLTPFLEESLSLAFLFSFFFIFPLSSCLFIIFLLNEAKITILPAFQTEKFYSPE